MQRPRVSIQSVPLQFHPAALVPCPASPHDPGDLLGGIDDLIAGFGLESWTHAGTRVLHGPNWKLAFDAHLEFYHVPVLHRETFGPDRSNRAFYFAQGAHQRVIAPQSRPGMASRDDLYALGRVPGADEPVDPLLMGEWILFPGVSINTFYPHGQRGVLLSVVVPGAEVGTSTTTQTFLAETAPDEVTRGMMDDLGAFLAHVVGDAVSNNDLCTYPQEDACPYLDGQLDETVQASVPAGYHVEMGGEVEMRTYLDYR